MIDVVKVELDIKHTLANDSFKKPILKHLDPNEPGLDRDTKARREVLQEMEKKSPEEIMQLAIEVGIYNKDGTLTKEYGGKDDSGEIESAENGLQEKEYIVIINSSGNKETIFKELEVLGVTKDTTQILNAVRMIGLIYIKDEATKEYIENIPGVQSVEENRIVASIGPVTGYTPVN